MYLAHWMRRSGLVDGRQPPAGGDDRARGIVDFSILPHVAHEHMPGDTMADAEKWAREIAAPYAIDDETATRVVDGALDVVSEGHWRFFAP